MLLKDMLTRCNQCGYENGPNYRFCGMCGAPLQTSEPGKTAAPSRAPEQPAPVSGPSFLGLADEPNRNLDYLLEDEEPHSSHWRLYLALIILVIAGAVIGVRWWRYGFPWAGLRAGTAQTAAPANQAAPPAETPSATSSTPAEGQPAAAQPASGTTAPSPSPESVQSAPPPQPLPTEGAAQPSPAPQETEAAKPPGTEAEQAAEASSSPAPQPEKPMPQPAKVTPAPSGLDKLVAEGERYLYGNGVPEDCGRALKNISAAAARSNVRAQTLMGAMYATGHCASHDLPTAYRWFARALRNDPGNTRLERDLQMVWNQMTPGERQIATRSQ